MNIYLMMALMGSGAYLIGSIPNGYLIVKWRKGFDIRTIGSGSMGATNVARECGWLWGIITIIVDFLKGYLPTSLALWFWGLHWMTGLIGFLAVVGHIFPVLIPKPRLKGGKGVSTTTGVLIPILVVYLITYPHFLVLVGLVFIITSWLAIVLIFRRRQREKQKERQMGPANLYLMAWSMLYFAVLEALTYLNFLSLSVFCMTALVLWAHRENWKKMIKEAQKPN